MKYVDFLCNILESLGCEVDGSSVLIPGTDEPVKVKVRDNKGEYTECDLVIPTRDRLQANDWSKVVAFHPACENITSGESEVFRFLTRYVKTAIIERSLLLAKSLLQLEASKDKKRSTYAKFLSKFPGIDKNSAAELDRFLAHLAKENRVTSLLGIAYERNGKLISDPKTAYSRVLNYYSTLVEETNDDAVILGYKFRSKAQKNGIRELLLKLLMGGQLQRGSNGDAPYFEVLMGLWVEFAEHWNEIAKIIEKDIKLEPIDVSFKDAMEKLHAYRSRIVALPGNTGDQILKRPSDEDDLPPFDVDDVQKSDFRKTHEPEPRREESADAGSFFMFAASSEISSRNTTGQRSTGNPMDFRHTGGRGLGGLGGYDRDRDRGGFGSSGFGGKRGGFGGGDSRFGSLGRSREDEERAKKFGRR